MQDVEASPRWQRRAEERPQELLDAALAVFVERGFAAARLEEVAKRAGVSKGTVYLYFSGKEELLKALVQSAIVPQLENVEALAREHSGASRELLIKMVDAMWRGIALSPLSGIPKLMLSEAGNFPELARFFLEAVIQRHWALMRQVMEEGMANGEFRRLPADLAVRIFVAPMMMAVFWKHSFMPLEETPLDMERYFAVALDMSLAGIAAQATNSTTD
ncbi:MAG: TetR/AcrR family transcriptional regulator [Gallionellaceae bacterium]|nr:TetR/AcrR family transcriptional regulator [Gallionellaceae bacterium]